MQKRLCPLPLLLVAITTGGCTPPDPAAPDPVLCDTEGAPSTCLSPTLPADDYAALSSAYFDTMDYTVELEAPMPYAELVARWEWPPWLLLTAFGRDNIAFTDTLLQLYPSVVPERECYGFDTQPFGRCRVVFYYDSHDGLPCPIYEEFTFNDAGEITFIEAWSDLPGYLPMDAEADPWAEGAVPGRLSTRIPGLGTSDGLIDLDGPEMTAAAEQDADIAEFVWRASDWYTTWLEALRDAGDLWTEGCGWDG